MSSSPFSQVLRAHLVHDDVTPDRPCTRLASSDTCLSRLLLRLNSCFFIPSQVVEPRRRDTGLPPTVVRREGVPAERQEIRILRTQGWSTSPTPFFSNWHHSANTKRRRANANALRIRTITGRSWELPTDYPSTAFDRLRLPIKVNKNNPEGRPRGGLVKSTSLTHSLETLPASCPVKGLLPATADLAAGRPLGYCRTAPLKSPPVTLRVKFSAESITVLVETGNVITTIKIIVLQWFDKCLYSMMYVQMYISICN